MIGIIQFSFYSYTGDYLTFNPEEVYDVLEVYGPLGFLIDIVVIGLLFRFFVKRQKRKKEAALTEEE